LKKRQPPKPPEVLHPSKGAAEAGEHLRLDIWKDPKSKDTLRVYADWLAEQGSKRGEHMQLRLLESPTEEQTAAAWTLLKKHGGEWLGEARPFVRSFSYSSETPGFLDRVDCEAPRFVEGFSHILKLGPRMRIVVTSMRTRRRETEAKMAALPLGDVWTLDLTANALDDKSLETLASGMKGLRALCLDRNDFGDKGLVALGSQVTTLRALSLYPAVKFGRDEAQRRVDSYVRAIVETPGFRSLRLLQIRGPSPSPELQRRLEELPELRTTDSGDYVMTDDRISEVLA